MVCLVDDILVCGKDQDDQRLEAVLNRLGAAGLTLNREKCEIYQRLGYVPIQGRSMPL